MSDYSRIRPAPTPMRLARALGWFSIGLGVAEMIAPRAISRMLGVRGHETLVRSFGAREIASGIGALTARDPSPWIKGRLFGDALDLAALSLANDRRNPRRQMVRFSVWSVLAVTALDFLAAEELKRTRQRRIARRHPAYDYSDRVGMAKSPDQMRGLAAKDYKPHPDMLRSAGP
jgi:hypothetical protein